MAYINSHEPHTVIAGLYRMREQIMERIDALAGVIAFLDEDDRQAIVTDIADWLVGSDYLSEHFYDTVADAEGTD